MTTVTGCCVMAAAAFVLLWSKPGSRAELAGGFLFLAGGAIALRGASVGD